MKNYLVIICTIIYSHCVFSQSSTEKYSRAKIYYSTPENFKQLLNSGVPLDHGKHKKGEYFESDFSASEIAIAKNMGLQVDIVIDDVKKYYQERNQTALENKNFRNNTCNNSSNNYPRPTNYNHGSMGGFLTYTEVMREIDSMALLYPNLITARAPIDTFQTYEGRNLHWVRISDNATTNENEPEVLYTAIHHAREPISIQQLIYYMWYLLENYATNPDIKAVVDNTELYFIPFVNPDGYIYNETTDPNGGGMWRKNRRDNGDGSYGVDNNRNYNYTDPITGPIWGGQGTSNIGFDPTYCGTGAFSEPENQAVKWFVEQNDFKLALNNHSYSDLLLYPFGYDLNKHTSDDSTFIVISDFMASKNNMTDQLSSLLYPAAGDSDDWMYGEAINHTKVFAFTPEIGSISQGFWPAVNDIDPLCQSTMFLNLTTAHLASHYARITDLQNSTIPSKTGFLKYKIQCVGLQAPSNFTVSIIPLTANITSVGSPKTYNNMNLLQIKIDSISYTLNSSIALGDTIKYIISAVSATYTINDTIVKTYGSEQILYSSNGNNTTGWLISQNWGVTNSTFYSPSSSITDSPLGNYSNNAYGTITLQNPVTLANAIDAHLNFWAKWEIQEDYDYVQCEISTDNGNTWEPQCGKYTNLGTFDQDYNQPLYDGFMTSWVKEEISLSDYLNKSILVRFKIVSDGNDREDGFYFDDLEISVNYGPNAIDELNNNEAYLGQSFPNPTTGNINISYHLPQGVDKANITITDAIGKTVLQKIITNNSTVTEFSIAELNAGVYYYFITGEGISTSETKKIVLIK